MTNLTLATYNVTHPQHQRHKPELAPGCSPWLSRPWAVRASEVRANLAALDADLVCLQDVNSDMVQAVCGQFNIISYAPHYRDGREAQHGVAILANQRIFDQVKHSRALIPANREGQSIACAFLEVAGRRLAVLSLQLSGYTELQMERYCQRTQDDGAVSPAYQGYDQLFRTIVLGNGLLARKGDTSPVADILMLAGDFAECIEAPSHMFNRRDLVQEQGYVCPKPAHPSLPESNRSPDWICARAPFHHISLTPQSVELPYPEASRHRPVLVGLQL